MIKRVLTFSDNVHALHATADGLWIAHQGGVTCLDPRTGVATKWTTRDGLPAHPVLHVATDGDRVAVATPNGVAWHDNVHDLLRDGASGQVRWERGLAHPMGAGAYANGVAFVQGRIHAATGGGRLYREGAKGFELLELPLRQARLVRLQQLASPKKTLRLLLVTNNSGVLLLATGGSDEPSLYQWGEEEGLCSRYVTAMTLAGQYVALAVHGCVHVASQRMLVERPDELARWGRIHLPDVTGPSEHNRIPALTEHADHLCIGTSAGLYRVPLAALETASQDPIEAERLDDAPVRHMASLRGELWVVHAVGVGRYLEAGAQTSGRYEVQEPESRIGSIRSRFLRPRFGSRTVEPVPVQQLQGTWKRWRFVPETRWRVAHAEPECRQVLSLAASPDGIGAGGEAGRVLLMSSGRWTTEIVARLRRPPEVHSIVYDPENATFWAATRYGLYQRDPRGRWHRDLTFPGRTVHMLTVWGGSVVALGSAGLHLFVQNEWSEIELPGDIPALFVGAPSDGVLALAARPGSGFLLWRAGAPHPEPVLIPVGRANCMTWGEAGELWIGSDRGLARWDGTGTETFAWNDEKRDHVTSLLAYRDRLFVGSQAGVWVAPLAKLRPASGDALESFGERLGLLQGLPDTNVTALVVHDSDVWIGTQGGLALLE
jgi:ligand-binding sensor domain-containing protein